MIRPNAVDHRPHSRFCNLLLQLVGRPVSEHRPDRAADAVRVDLAPELPSSSASVPTPLGGGVVVEVATLDGAPAPQLSGDLVYLPHAGDRTPRLGAWDAMLRWEDQHAGTITSVPGIPPAPIGSGLVDTSISSQAGLAALRAGARRAF